jgi:hypothetical protein
MRPRTPKALNLSLNLVGAFSLALAASSAEASTMGAEDEFCSTCDKDDPQARANYDHKPKPTEVAATRPAKPEAKTTPEFTADLVPLPAAESITPEVVSKPDLEQAEVASPELAAAPVPEPALEATSESSVTPDPSETSAAAPSTKIDHAVLEQPSVPAASLTSETHAAPPSLETALAESSKPDDELAAAPAPGSDPRVVPAISPAAGLAAASAPILEPQTIQDPTTETPSSAVTPAPTAAPQKPVSVSLPPFVETSRVSTNLNGTAPASAQPLASEPTSAPSRPADSLRSGAAQPSVGRTTVKRPVNLLQLQAGPELVATDVLSVWNRFIPFPDTPAAQDWAQDLPAEAVPTTRVQAPAARARQAQLSRSVPVAMAPTESLRPPSPQLPSFDLPQPQARATATTATETIPRQEPLNAQTGPSDQPQGDTSSSVPANIQREDLLIEPLATDPVPTARYSPSPNAGVPSAFGAAWGDVFASATVTGADQLRNEVDGSISAGFGVGNPATAVGVELAYNLLSLRNFAENGSFDAKVHREVFTNDTTQAAVAVGWNNFVNYGDDVAGTESSVYGVVSAAHLLQPEHPTHRLPITGTLGVGGGNFSGDNSDVGVIAGVGLQVDPRLSLNAAWSGVGLNVAASVAPLPEIPLTLNFLYGDITNNTEAGSVAAFTVGYGFNFGPRF